MCTKMMGIILSLEKNCMRKSSTICVEYSTVAIEIEIQISYVHQNNKQQQAQKVYVKKGK